MAEAREALGSLRRMIQNERELQKERLASGNTNYPEIVGRCKALEWVADKILDQMKSDNQGASDDDDKG